MVVSHAGSRRLADLADAVGLTGTFTQALRHLRPRGAGHVPGRIVVDLAVMLADGSLAIADLAVLRDRPVVFGPVASTPTALRLLPASTRRRWLRCAQPGPRHRVLHATRPHHPQRTAPVSADRRHLARRHELTSAFARLAALHRPAT